jgi:Flp pilus assembly protein TadG
MKSSPTTHPERGAAILEGTLILLAVFAVVFSIWEAGRLMNVQQCVTNGAREGARYAVAPLAQNLCTETTRTTCMPSDDQIRTRVNIYLQAASISGATITINDGGGKDTPVAINGIQYTKVNVTVAYSFLSLPLLNNLTATLHGVALMRNETSP